MDKTSLARQCLEKARRFADRAREAGPTRRVDLIDFLEAAIVFGRSVTWHLQKDYRHRQGFDEWYAQQQANMGADELCVFLNCERTFIVHERPVAAHEVLSVSLPPLHVSVSAHPPTVIIGDRPWCVQRARTLWQKVRAAAGRAVQPCRALRRAAEAAAEGARGPSVTARRDFFFDGAKWEDRPVLDLVEEYIAKLEAIVTAAEQRFGAQASQRGR